MRMSDLTETARSMNQAYRPKAEKDPVQVIDRDTANAFNKLLDESKKKFPENSFVKKMKPVDSSRTQLAGLLSKVPARISPVSLGPRIALPPLKIVRSAPRSANRWMAPGHRYSTG